MITLALFVVTSGPTLLTRSEEIHKTFKDGVILVLSCDNVSRMLPCDGNVARIKVTLGILLERKEIEIQIIKFNTNLINYH